MSWQASRLVVLHGPEDGLLYRLCTVVAEAADPSGLNARLGQRLLAERCRVSQHRLRDLIGEAIECEWLVQAHRGDGSGPSLYDLGPRFGEAEARARVSGNGREARAAVSADSAQGVNTSRPIGREVIGEGHESAGQESGPARASRPIERAPGSRTVLPIRSTRMRTPAPARRRAPALGDQAPPDVPPSPPPRSGEYNGAPVDNDVVCDVSRPDFEAARAVLRRGRRK